MELTKEVIEAQKLSDDQVSVLNKFGTDSESLLVANAKKEYDGKANTDAEAILHGATESIVKLTGRKHEAGVKVEDYFKSAWDDHSKSQMTVIENKQKELDDKIANAEKGGNEVLAGEFKSLKAKFDDLQVKEAEFDRIADGDFEKKFTDLSTQHSGLLERQSFQSVKPSFDDKVNAYEVDAKWANFIKTTLETNHIKMVDGVAKAIDKDNEHKITDLKDLVEKDTDLKELAQGRSQEGPNGDPTKFAKITGVPFDVPEDSKTNTAARTAAIKDHLAKEGIPSMDDRFVGEFKKYNELILGITKA
jgi:hypothetical protein